LSRRKLCIKLLLLHIQISSSTVLLGRFNHIRQILSDSNIDWTKRVNAVCPNNFFDSVWLHLIPFKHNSLIIPCDFFYFFYLVLYYSAFVEVVYFPLTIETQPFSVNYIEVVQRLNVIINCSHLIKLMVSYIWIKFREICKSTSAKKNDIIQWRCTEQINFLLVGSCDPKSLYSGSQPSYIGWPHLLHDLNPTHCTSPTNIPW